MAKMTDSTKPSTLRMRAFNARRKAGITLPRCRVCNKKCTAPASIEAKMCSSCRNFTTPGRRQAIANVYKAIQRKKTLQTRLGSLDSFHFDWQPPETHPEAFREVLAETKRGAQVMAIYDINQGWLDVADGSKLSVVRWAYIVITMPEQEAS